MPADVTFLDEVVLSEEERELIQNLLSLFEGVGKTIRVTNIPNGYRVVELEGKLPLSKYEKVIGKLRELLYHAPPRRGKELFVFKSDNLCVFGHVAGFSFHFSIILIEEE